MLDGRVQRVSLFALDQLTKMDYGFIKIGDLHKNSKRQF
jgi:hypothetical protein